MGSVLWPVRGGSGLAGSGISGGSGLAGSGVRGCLDLATACTAVWLLVCASVFHSLTNRSVSAVAQSCPALSGPLDCSTPGLPVRHLPESAQTMSIELVMPSNHLILCCPRLLPSVFSSIRVFFSESAFHIRWPKYCSFSFSISPSSEYSRLISLGWTGLI